MTRRLPSILLMILIVGTGPLLADVLVAYEAGQQKEAVNPTTMGWRELKGDMGIGGPENDEGDREPAWKIGDASSNVNRLTYRKTYEPEEIVGKNWEATAVLRVVSANAEKLRDAFFQVQDGMSEWTVVFVKDGSREGVGFIDNQNQWQTLQDGDVSSQFITIGMSYRYEDDAMTILLNGQPVGKTLTRLDVPETKQNSRFYVTWGDDASAVHPATARSEVLWRMVKLETSEEKK